MGVARVRKVGLLSTGSWRIIISGVHLVDSCATENAYIFPRFLSQRLQSQLKETSGRPKFEALIVVVVVFFGRLSLDQTRLEQRNQTKLTERLGWR